MLDSCASSSAKRDDTKCANCALMLRRTGGRQKVVQNDDESFNYSNKMGKPIQIGDILCARCRLIIYREKTRDKEDDIQVPSTSTVPQLSANVLEFPEADIKEATKCVSIKKIQSESSSLSLQSSISSLQSLSIVGSQSSSNDPTFVPRLNEKENEILEMPFQRVVASHKYCFLCSSSTEIINVPFEARIQVFQKKKNFYS